MIALAQIKSINQSLSFAGTIVVSGIVSGIGRTFFFGRGHDCYIGTCENKYDTDSPLCVRLMASAKIILTSMHCIKKNKKIIRTFLIQLNRFRTEISVSWKPAQRSIKG